IPCVQQFIYFLDRILRTLPRPIPVSIRLQLRFPDGFQHQLRSSLRHPVPYRRYPERTLAAAGLWDHHPPHRLWSIRLVPQFLSEAIHPLCQPSGLDVREALPIHSRRASIGSRQSVSMGQNIFPVHLVIELIETESRLVLRLAIQLDLKFPYLTRRCQTHRQSPFLSSFSSTPEARALSSAGITRPRRSYGPLRLPDWPSPFLTSFGGATSASPEPPPITQITFPACRAYYPG